jgi:hypothetical protein
MIEQGLNEEAERLENNVALLRAMHHILLADIRVFETGDRQAIEALMSRDEHDLQALEQWDVNDIEIQENLSDLWDHLPGDDERMLRLRLIGVITWQQQDNEKAMARETQVNVLLQGMQTLDIEENRRAVARNQEATYIAKSELSDLLSELKTEAEQAGSAQARRTREMWKEDLMVCN